MKMNKQVMFEMVADRKNELKAIIAEVKVSDTLTDNTRGTKLYALRKEQKTLGLLAELIKQGGENVDMTEEAYEQFLLLTRLQDERRKAASFYVDEGENIVSIMERYPNRRNLMKSITEYCADNGLVLDATKMIIVKA